MHKGLLRVLCSISLFFFLAVNPLTAQDNTDTKEKIEQVENKAETEKAAEGEKKDAEKAEGGEKKAEEVPTVGIPFLVVFLIAGATFFTIWYGFINFKMFSHSLNVIRGKYDNPNDKGEISHFKALTSALSATVGLGNIAGVAVAIQLGGPGAVFWMTMAAVLGMTAKFSSCTLGQLYRKENANIAGNVNFSGISKAVEELKRKEHTQKKYVDKGQQINVDTMGSQQTKIRLNGG